MTAVSPNLTASRSRRWQAFGLSLLVAALFFLPFVIMDKGYFIFYGDFNVQQIPFYRLAHEAVRSGDIFWNWYTDLGVNFIGSYSFYLLFSPFFWLTLPFPTSFIPYLMAPLLILKMGCAAFTSCIYLERFVKDNRYAVLGGLLYAFSGYSLFNIFFNHFHDVMVFFPLLLIAVEMLVTENRRGFLIAAVFINAIVNYWFFIGEVVFVLLYVLIRMTASDWRMSLKKFLLIALESVLGTGLAGFVLLPSALALMGNPRTGTDQLVNGWGFWLYWHEQRLPAILQSLFFPPELPARPNFLPDHGAKWASLSAWLPLLSVTGVIAFFRTHRYSWLKKMLAICLVFALIPGLNSAFILLNDSYYARWFYMPILLMSLATVVSLEECVRDNRQYLWSCKAVLAIILVYMLAIGLTPRFDEDGALIIGLMQYQGLFWIYCAAALLGLAGTWALVRCFRRHPRFFRTLTASVCAMIVTFSVIFIANGKVTMDRSRTLIDSAIEGRYKLLLPEEPFARADVYKGEDNQAMFWHIPNIQAFHSIIPSSIMEFYPMVGVKRDVSSKPETDYYALRPLLSVRWLFIPENQEKQSPMPGYTKYGNQLGFNVYQNDCYLPMGFGYTHYFDAGQLESVDKRHRSNIMLRAVYLEDEDAIARNADLLSRLRDSSLDDFSEDTYYRDVENRARQLAYSFETDTHGFTSRANLDRETFLFFSVPYDKGWSATINGQPAVIEKANIGFMAVRVPAGDSMIRFDYMPPGLIPGLWASLGFLLLAIAYLLAGRRWSKGPVPRTWGELGIPTPGGPWSGVRRPASLEDSDWQSPERSFGQQWGREIEPGGGPSPGEGDAAADRAEPSKQPEDPAETPPDNTGAESPSSTEPE